MRRLCTAPQVIHLDVKPSNVLLEGVMCEPKLSDFGSSKVLTSKVELCSNGAGTAAFRAPEVWDLRGAEPPLAPRAVYTSADMFSFAAVLVCMARCSVSPYPGEIDRAALERRVPHGLLRPCLPQVLSRWSRLVGACTQHRSSQRLSAAQAINELDSTASWNLQPWNL